MLALLAIEAAVLAERIASLRRHRHRVDASRLATRVLDDLRAGDLDRVARDLAAQPALETAALARAMRWYGAGPAVFDDVLSRAFAARVREDEIGLALLAVLAIATPLAAITAMIATPGLIATAGVAAAVAGAVPALWIVRTARVRRLAAVANLGVIEHALVANMHRPQLHVRTSS